MTTINFQIKIIKHQIKATLKLIADGIKSYIDQLIILEGKLERLEEALKPSLPSEANVAKFEVGKFYSTHSDSFKAKILRRTDKTVWYEIYVDGVKHGFFSEGRQKIKVVYGRETFIDGIHKYAAGEMVLLENLRKNEVIKTSPIKGIAWCLVS